MCNKYHLLDDPNHDQYETNATSKNRGIFEWYGCLIDVDTMGFAIYDSILCFFCINKLSADICTLSKWPIPINSVSVMQSVMETP